MKYRERNYGLDALRVVAMFMITLYHLANQHFHLLSQNGSQYFYGSIIITICFCGVNCFAMLSGYLLGDTHNEYDKKLLGKILSLWSKAIVWGVVIWGWLYLIDYFSIISIRYFLSWKGVIRLLSPMTYGCCFCKATHGWWYISAYMGLMVLLPVTTKALQTMEAKALMNLSLFLFVFFSIIPMFTLHEGSLGLNFGYSTLWLEICFIWGYVIKKYNNNLNRKLLFVVFLLCIIIPSIMLLLKYKCFLNYLSPFCVLEAATLLSFFSKFSFDSAWVKKGLESLSRNSLGIYLLQCHPGIWDNFFKYFKCENITNGFFWKIPLYGLLFCFMGILFNVFIDSMLRQIKRLWNCRNQVVR